VEGGTTKVVQPFEREIIVNIGVAIFEFCKTI
jgi:hypothetical protein